MLCGWRGACGLLAYRCLECAAVQSSGAAAQPEWPHAAEAAAFLECTQLALPTRPPLSPLKLAALDTVFVAATVVALVCSVLLAADIMRYGLWPQQATAASHGSGYPAGALVAVGPAEQQPMLIVVAADEVAAAQQAGYTKL